MEVLKVAVLTNTGGSDQVILTLDMPEGVWPFSDNATARIDVSANKGVEYAKKNFNCVITEIDVSTGDRKIHEAPQRLTY